MDGTTTKPVGNYDLAREAEALIRCLEGVVRASVHAGTRGIDAIHVTADDEGSARAMPARVRSALLAGLATPVLPARIHVRIDAWDDDAPEVAADFLTGPDLTGTDGAGENGGERRLRLIGTRLPAPEPAPVTRTAPRGASATAKAPELLADEAGAAYTARPHLVAVDLDRPGDGRVLCRVAVAYDAAVHRAEAAAIDLPGAAAQAAAQAAVRALGDAGLRGIELGGLREVEIAGRDYVLVALRRTDSCPRHRSGSAPVVDSPERAAARAVVAAANDIL